MATWQVTPVSGSSVTGFSIKNLSGFLSLQETMNLRWQSTSRNTIQVVCDCSTKEFLSNPIIIVTAVSRPGLYYLNVLSSSACHMTSRFLWSSYNYHVLLSMNRYHVSILFDIRLFVVFNSTVFCFHSSNQCVRFLRSCVLNVSCRFRCVCWRHIQDGSIQTAVLLPVINPKTPISPALRYSWGLYFI